MEQVDLTAAVTYPSMTYYKVERLTLDWPAALIYITLKGTNGEAKSFDYSGVTATNLMIALNKANLSIKSLQKRILEQLITDGKLAGTISGSPD